MRVVAGIDGCRAGWFSTSFGPDGSHELFLAREINTLWTSLKSAHLLLIDMPIGLVDEGPAGRACDRDARTLLGRYASRVFTPPLRPSLECSSHAEASARNKQLGGPGISVQSWNIAPKIRALDILARENREVTRRLRETHPELVFRALNGGGPVRTRKKTEAGAEHRLALLRHEMPHIDTIVEEALREFRRADVGRDDIIDSAALAIAASHGRNRLTSIPESPHRDAYGLPMEIVYWEPNRVE